MKATAIKIINTVIAGRMCVKFALGCTGLFSGFIAVGSDILMLFSETHKS
jgi:hypothetical protein